MNDDLDMARERHDEREAMRRDRCQCGGDMPGRCPGPAFCPMCQPDTE
jgi:hypothetical protein